MPLISSQLCKCLGWFHPTTSTHTSTVVGPTYRRGTNFALISLCTSQSTTLDCNGKRSITSPNKTYWTISHMCTLISLNTVRSLQILILMHCTCYILNDESSYWIEPSYLDLLIKHYTVLLLLHTIWFSKRTKYHLKNILIYSCDFYTTSLVRRS